MTANDDSAEVGQKIQEYSRRCEKVKRLQTRNREIARNLSPLMHEFEHSPHLAAEVSPIETLTKFFDDPEIRSHITEVQGAVSERKKLEEFLRAKGLDNLIRGDWIG